MAKKRANHEGSVYQIADGTWRGAVSIGGGKRKYARGDTQAEVVKKLAEIKAKLGRGESLAEQGRQTVGDFLDEWLDSIKASVRPRTHDAYESHVRVHIRPGLGGIRLADLTTQHVQRWIDRLAASGASARSIRRYHGALHTALERAERWGLVRSNVAAAKLLDLPRVEDYEWQPLTLDESQRFLAVVKGYRLEALYTVALALGLRKGEILGLRWQDVDLDAGHMWIRRQLQINPRGDGAIRLHCRSGLVPTKTHKSKRPLPLPAAIVEQLRAHRTRQLRERLSAREWLEFDLVFTTPKGTPLDGGHELRRFHAFLDAAGLERRRFHDMRHSAGSLLHLLGVPARDIQAILGHAHIQTTMIYVHGTTDTQRAAAERASDALFQADQNPVAAEPAAETGEEDAASR